MPISETEKIDYLAFESDYKKFEYVAFGSAQLQFVNDGRFQPYIKIALVPPGFTLTVDFNLYETQTPALFFIAPNQYLNFLNGPENPVQMLCYNRDFYCIQIHDSEVACDGLLFNNILEVPKVNVDADDLPMFENLFKNIAKELQFNDSSSEEMIRTYLKQIIIHATRNWKKQNITGSAPLFDHSDKELFRNFGLLVEIHFKAKHSVNDYADLLNLAPKTLANKFNKLQLENPNDIIKKRIVLEAKRLLFYTALNVKEIAHQLGYEDPAYFNRLFSQKVGASPVEFRKRIKT